jgi:nicotinate-nucleotide pyrophosphorylase
MKLHRSVIRLILFTSLAGALSAAEVDGVLMDKMCSMKAAKEGQKAATMHTRQCAMMPDCEKSGYGVFTADNEYLVFDPVGNEQASAALKASKKKDNLKVKVSGEIDGDTIKVASLKLQ